MDIIERLDAAIKTEDFWVGDQREDNILKDSKKIIEQLRKAMDVQANAVNVLHQAETSELNHLRKTAQEAYMAKMTLDSEREANRILTDEIEQLQEVLRFYAEWGIDAPAVDAIIEEDCGDKAREALNIVLADLEKDHYL